MSSGRDFERPDSELVEVRVRGASARYLVREMTHAEAERVLAKDGEGSQVQRLIAACVSREDGTRLTIEDVAAMRASVVRQLTDHVLRVNGLADEGN